MTALPCSLGVEFPSQVQCGVDIGAGGDAHQDAFDAREAFDHAVRVLGFEPEIAVGEVGVVDAGDNGRRHVLEAFEAVEAGFRLTRDAFDAGEFLAEAAGGPHEGSAGAEGGDEVGDAPLGLGDDLGTCGVKVAAPASSRGLSY